MSRKSNTRPLTRRTFLRSFAVGVAMTKLSPGTLTDARGDALKSLDSIKASRPNIIFILADDMGYGDLSILGQKNFTTPNLDNMAEEGMILTDHYAGSTVCAPSRATLLTGQHTGHVYQRGNGRIEFRPDPHDITIATRLKEAGYHTAMIGKSGVACNSVNASLPNEKGFDHFFGFLAHAAAHRFYPTELIRNGKTVTYPQNNGRRGEIYSGDLFLEDTLNYLDERSQSKQPFFLHFALQQPHADLSVPEEFRHPFLNKYEEQQRPRGGYTRQRHPAATYAGMIAYVDHTVRRILQKLRELRIEKNTLVIFSSDNGSYSEGGYHYSMHNSNAPFRGGKRDLYDGGIRVPTLAWWPDTITPGSRSDHVSAFWDFAPTALELAGLSIPKEMDGTSYLPTLAGEPNRQKKHHYLYWEFYEQGGKQAVRYGPWKGIRLNVQRDRHGPIELYNIVKDPGETHNLAEQHPDIVRKIDGFMDEAHTTPEHSRFRF